MHQQPIHQQPKHTQNIQKHTDTEHLQWSRQTDSNERKDQNTRSDEHRRLRTKNHTKQWRNIHNKKPKTNRNYKKQRRQTIETKVPKHRRPHQSTQLNHHRGCKNKKSPNTLRIQTDNTNWRTIQPTILNNQKDVLQPVQPTVPKPTTMMTNKKSEKL